MQAHPMPAEGIRLDPHGHLFIADVDVIVNERMVTERRAFIDFEAVLTFVGKNPSRISAFLCPIGPTTDSALYGTVQKAFKSLGSNSYTMTFANASNMVVRVGSAPAEEGVYPGIQVYPPEGR